MKINDIMKNFWGMVGKGEDLIKKDKHIHDKVLSLDEYLKTNYQDIQEKEDKFLKKLSLFYKINISNKIISISTKKAFEFLIAKNIPFYDYISTILDISTEYIETYTNLEIELKGRPSIDQFMDELENNNVKHDIHVSFMGVYVYILLADKKDFIKNKTLVKRVYRQVNKYLIDNIEELAKYPILEDFLKTYTDALYRILKSNNKGENHSISLIYNKNVNREIINPSIKIMNIIYKYISFNLEKINLNLDK